MFGMVLMIWWTGSNNCFKSDIFPKMLEMLGLKGIYYFPNSNLDDLFTQIFGLEQISSFSSDISYSALNIIFQMLTTINENLIEINKNVPEIIKKAKIMIDESLQNKLTINDICQKLYISKPSLIANFKKYYGVTPNTYKSKKKIQLACMYLKNSNLNMDEISSNLGFSDTYTFSHWFKREKEISPLAYRKKHRSK